MRYQEQTAENMALFSQWTFRNILWKCNFVSTDVSRMVSVKEICWFLYIRISSFETYIFVVFFLELILFEILYRFCFYTFILLYYLMKLKIENHMERKINALLIFILFILFFIIYYILYKLYFSISKIYKSINLSTH